MKKVLAIMLALLITCAFTACGSDDKDSSKDEKGIDYMALVNKLNPLPEGWEDALETVHMTNSVGDDVEVEKKAYAAYEKLKKELEDEDVYVDLDSARRSVEQQQKIMDDFTKKYGEEYAKKTVAQPGYSEHHTGLALDLYLIIDGKDVTANEDMVKYPKIWEKIHAKLADHGFILRYLDGREHITGYGYEPWHIRYIDDADKAKEIMADDITFEEFLSGKKAPEVKIDYGKSDIYSKKDLENAAVQIKCEFASMAGCELHSLSYAGDSFNTEKNLKWLKSLDEGTDYVEVAKFLSDFHSPKEDAGALEPDKEYKDYEWWLARTKDGDWSILSQGYN